MEKPAPQNYLNINKENPMKPYNKTAFQSKQEALARFRTNIEWLNINKLLCPGQLRTLRMMADEMTVTLADWEEHNETL